MITTRQAVTLNITLLDIDDVKAFSAAMSPHLPHYLGIDAQLPTSEIVLIFGAEYEQVDAAEIAYGVQLAEAMER